MATPAERRAGTQAAVMKAARRLFGERGFAATSMDDVAAASRVAKGAIYHYFKTKNDLFEAVFEQASSDLVQEIDLGDHGLFEQNIGGWVLDQDPPA